MELGRLILKCIGVGTENQLGKYGLEMHGAETTSYS